jgi:hypothetical protein
MIHLPKTLIPADTSDPGMIIIYGPPKCGKTTLISKIPNNLILDLENGARFIERLSVNIIGWQAPDGETEAIRNNRWEDKKYYITEVGRQIIEDNYPYDFLTIDTATVLEEMVMPLAVAKYKASPMGGGYTGNDVRELPRGAGYLYLRQAFDEALKKLKKLSKHLILIAHVKDAVIDKEGKEVNAKDIELTGKIKFITCADADAVGYLHRGTNNELMLNFKSSDEIICGSRCSHLKGRNIVVAEYDDTLEDLVNVNWGAIFPSLNE